MKMKSGISSMLNVEKLILGSTMGMTVNMQKTSIKGAIIGIRDPVALHFMYGPLSLVMSFLAISLLVSLQQPFCLTLICSLLQILLTVGSSGLDSTKLVE